MQHFSALNRKIFCIHVFPNTHHKTKTSDTHEVPDVSPLISYSKNSDLTYPVLLLYFTFVHPSACFIIISS